MSPILELFSPADGSIFPLEQVPDPVFSQHMLGNGFAIDAAKGEVFAPCGGTITNINPNKHALVISQNGFELLVHIGVETVSLKGKGFTLLVKQGQKVSQGQPLLTFDLDFLKKSAPCAWIICAVTAPQDVPVQALASGRVKQGQKIASAGEAEKKNPPESAPAAAPVFYSEQICIVNPNGLHARPAAVLAKLATQFNFPLYLVKGEEKANAKSIVEIMGLALEQGAAVQLQAHTADESRARHALEKLTAALREGLGESETKKQQPAGQPAAVDFSAPVTLKALCACAGLAHGTAWKFAAGEIPFEEAADNIQQQEEIFKTTLTALEKELQDEAANSPSNAAKEILSAHLFLLKDPFLLARSKEVISQGKTASFAFNEAIRASIDLLKKTQNRFLMERIADLKDLRKRVLLKISGKEETPPAFPDGCIVFAEDLLPSDLSFFDAHVRGVVLAQGSPTAHSAIMLRNMGIPTLVAAGEAVLNVPAGSKTYIDAAEGLLFVNPSAQEEERLNAKFTESARKEAELKQSGQGPALTKNGLRVLVGGNVSNEKEALYAYQNGADTLGLVRTEFLFLQGTTTPPSEEAQLACYQQIVNAMHGRPVTLRTLDIGGDKPVEFVRLPKEQNPVLGLRGVRTYELNEPLFRAQIRAMLRVKPAGVVRIMLPMISFIEEAALMRRLIKEEQQNLGIEAPLEIGIMVEVPSAALLAEQFAEEVDFFSIGTNDLTQYTLAIDRGHPSLAARADHLNPAVLHLIAATGRAGKKHHKPVAVCGAMAGDSQAVPLLVGLGVTELAVSAQAVGKIKSIVRMLDEEFCTQAAQQALSLKNAKQVRAFVHKTFHI